MQPLTNLFKLMRYRWWLYAGTLCVSLALYTLGIIPALIARWIFDSLTEGAQLTVGLWSMIALLVVTTVARQTLYVIQVVGRTTDAYTLGGLIRSNLMQHLLSKTSASTISSGEAISRFRDDVQGVTGFIDSSVHFLSSMAFGIVSAFILWRVNPTITLTVFVPLIVVTIIVNQSRTRVARYREQSQAATSQVTGMLGEMFSGILTLKLYNSEIHALDRLQKLNQEREAAAVQDRMFGELLDTVSGNLSDIGAGVILLLVGQAMQSGSFTVGDFALFVYILPWAGTFTNAFGGILAGYRRLGVSWARLATMLDGDDPARLTQAHALPLRADIPVGAYETNPITSSLVVASPKTPVQRLSTKGDNSPFLMCGRLGGGLLYEARGLTFTYPDSANGVHAVDLQLPPSSLTVITGRIGSGKSTLLRLLLGLLPKEAGEIYWHGELVTDPDRFFVPPRTAYTPQTPALFSNSLRANILMGLDLSGNEEGFAESHRDWHKDSQRARKENAEAQASVETALQNAIHAAVLEEDINMLEQGLDTLVGPRGVRLSGGQLLRSAAARMFVRQPELLVFDDLSSALDAETENLLWDRLFGHGHQLENAQPHATCLIVSHRQSALQRADNILVLEEGRVTDSGRLEDLLQRSEEMQQLYQGGENG